ILCSNHPQWLKFVLSNPLRSTSMSTPIASASAAPSGSVLSSSFSHTSAAATLSSIPTVATRVNPEWPLPFYNIPLEVGSQRRGMQTQFLSSACFPLFSTFSSWPGAPELIGTLQHSLERPLSHYNWARGLAGRGTQTNARSSASHLQSL